MTAMLTFTVAARVAYTAILLFIILFLSKELWSLWSDRQLTFGELKYFEASKLDEGASLKLRQLIKSEYDAAVDLIGEQPEFDFASVLGEKPLSQSQLPQRLEKLPFKAVGLSDIDLSFQGINVSKLFSSFRTSLSPSVDLQVVVLRQGDKAKMIIRWPNEARPLLGKMFKLRDHEFEISGDDAKLAKAFATNLIWLQAASRGDGHIIKHGEFNLWLEGLRILQQVRNERDGVSLLPSTKPEVIKSFAEQFLPALGHSYKEPETYRVASSIMALAHEHDGDFALPTPGGAGVSAEFLSYLFSLQYASMLAKGGYSEDWLASRYSNQEAPGAGRKGAAGFVDAVRGRLNSEQVVPFSKIREAMSGAEVFSENGEVVAPVIGSVTPDEVRNEVHSLLRVSANDGLIGTAFLVSEDVALTANSVVASAGGSSLKFERLVGDRWEELKHIGIVSLPGPWSYDIVAIKFEQKISGIVPFKLGTANAGTDVLGRSIRILAIGAPGDAKVAAWLLDLYSNEFNMPTYLYGTVLRREKRQMEIGYDALTIAGSGGAPVIDVATGAVIGINVKGAMFGELTKIAGGLEVTRLSSSVPFRKILGCNLLQQYTMCGIKTVDLSSRAEE